MAEFQSWRDLLTHVTNIPDERARLAGELGINPATLVRWVRAETVPRPYNFQQLKRHFTPQYRSQFVQLVDEEYPALALMTPEDMPVGESDVALFRGMFEIRATVPDSIRFWTISQRIFQHALRKLDPQRQGIAIIIVRCMPPASDGFIHSLREVEGQGTSPWESNLQSKLQFLGTESLAGHVVSTMRPEAIQNLSGQAGRIPAMLTENEVSAMAHPIIFANRVAGCLLVSSAQPNYFVSQGRRELIADYAFLLSLAFDPEEFYAPERISLRLLPSEGAQRPLLDQFQQRVLTRLAKSSSTGHPLSRALVEQEVWQELEVELIDQRSTIEVSATKR